jgi:hypothetical protein
MDGVILTLYFLIALFHYLIDENNPNYILINDDIKYH